MGVTYLAPFTGECTEMEPSRWFSAHFAGLIHLEWRKKERDWSVSERITIINKTAPGILLLPLESDRNVAFSQTRPQVAVTNSRCRQMARPGEPFTDQGRRNFPPSPFDYTRLMEINCQYKSISKSTQRSCTIDQSRGFFATCSLDGRMDGALENP